MKWTWTEDRMKLLSEMWRADEPVSAIAKALGPNCTRNMVIGKAHRMNLPGRDIAKFVRISQTRKFSKTAAAA